MTPRTALKAGLALAGALVFGYGIRVDTPAFRWAGIALIVAALVVRLARRGDDRDARRDDQGADHDAR